MPIRTLQSFRSFFGAVGTGESSRGRAAAAVHRPPWVPRVRTLEPRIVLNATAELVALGDLVISGDAADDTVDVTLNASGWIEILDANSDIIPIEVGTDLAGNPIFVDSIDPNLIASGRLSVNLGGGDDNLRVDVPVGLSVTVVDDLGNDSVHLSLRGDASGEANNTLNLAAENITIEAGGDDVDLGASSLQSTGAGGSITIEHAGSLQLGEVSVGAGDLRLGSELSPLGGDVSQSSGTSLEVGRLDVRALGGVDLSHSGNVIAHLDRIESGGDVDVHSDVSSLPAATLSVNRIDAITGTQRGDITLTVNGSIQLVSSDFDSDNVLSTDNGEIRVFASDDLQIDDYVSTNNSFDDASNYEIIAGGENGRLVMSAGGTLTAGDDVQIHASQITDAAVRIDAPRVVLGDNFEINTGEGTGVARRFVPRPELEVVEPGMIRPVPPGGITDPSDPNYVDIETAFYDPASVHTDILTQANANDAVGVLSVNLGVAGENGLTLSIDWGAPTNRFQRLEGLAGDHTQIDVAHVYLESDILDSTLNGRSSATDPLAVRFSVSHHDSIVITGDWIEQSVAPGAAGGPGGSSLQELVPGRLLTSTDNPLTPQLESGLAFFVIPRVNVPMAFLPVRNVIPEPIDPPPPVIVTSQIELTSINLDPPPTSASPPAIREEYFQLRTLSPDPQGEDLIEPIRLPENIMMDDQIEELFAALPDGAYEIEYVIGENDQRTILRVDLRGGQAVISGDDPEPGSLQLELIEGEEQRAADAPEARDPSAVDESALELPLEFELPLKKDDHES